ncbi:hypothetical protein CAOG_009763 [Capsaspora owczarzaki ATCC 30864]|uniref:Uncharacterized protein n=1 Tax=Capsaspora owczarzaki (strain ATCC 30864) TaxID=595528 RepID=A0A0D2X322_CAPO3|nr:hypothetical protein CAOG_009763 [Capsaspora owczarzaki ATCC 30864]
MNCKSAEPGCDTCVQDLLECRIFKLKRSKRKIKKKCTVRYCEVKSTQTCCYSHTPTEPIRHWRALLTHYGLDNQCTMRVFRSHEPVLPQVLFLRKDFLKSQTTKKPRSGCARRSRSFVRVRVVSACELKCVGAPRAASKGGDRLVSKGLLSTW